MYCPQCATQNIDAAKFCRVCGTNLEVVSLALLDNRSLLTKGIANSDLLKTENDSPKQNTGKRQVVQGGVLLAVSVLIALVGLVVSRGGFAWFPIWTVFFGWMACWGTVSLAFGLGRQIEARLTPRVPGSTAKITSALDAGRSVEISAPVSVTEHTTRHLPEKSVDC